MRHECGLRKKLQDKESVNQPLTKFISFNDSLWNIYHVLAIGGFPGGSDGRASACNVVDPGLTPGSGRSLGGRKWQPTPVFLPGKLHGQWSLVGYIVHGVTKSQT